MDKIYRQQQHEITEYHIYRKLAELSQDEENTKTLNEIAEQELEHYIIWQEITGKKAKPNQRKIRKYIRLAKIFGLSFALRLMEKGEVDATTFYNSIADEYPQALKIKEDEEEHEQRLIGILNDERLNYAGAIVLGFAGMPQASYVSYMLHLAVEVPMVTTFVAFSKWSHLAYRPMGLFFATLKKAALQKQYKTQLAPAT